MGRWLCIRSAEELAVCHSGWPQGISVGGQLKATHSGAFCRSAGRPGRLYTLAAQHHLAVIEDAAHAFPAKYKGRMIGAPTAGHDGTVGS